MGRAAATVAGFAFLAAVTWKTTQRIFPVEYEWGRLLDLMSLAAGLWLVSRLPCRRPAGRLRQRVDCGCCGPCWSGCVACSLSPRKRSTPSTPFGRRGLSCEAGAAVGRSCRFARTQVLFWRSRKGKAKRRPRLRPWQRADFGGIRPAVNASKGRSPVNGAKGAIQPGLPGFCFRPAVDSGADFKRFHGWMPLFSAECSTGRPPTHSPAGRVRGDKGGDVSRAPTPPAVGSSPGVRLPYPYAATSLDGIPRRPAGRRGDGRGGDSLSLPGTWRPRASTTWSGSFTVALMGGAGGRCCSTAIWSGLASRITASG